MDTEQLKRDICEYNRLKNLEAKYKKDADKLKAEIEKVVKDTLDNKVMSDLFVDKNVHLEKQIKITKAIDVPKLLKEHFDLVVDYVRKGQLNCTLAYGNTSKILKDNQIEIGDYSKSDTKEILTYEAMPEDVEEVEF